MPQGLIKETLPTEGESEENIQEERRLFYVGATRAKEKLYLTAANFYGDAKRKKKGSIFLSEILDRDTTQEFDNPKIVKSSDETSMYIPKSNDSLLPEDIKLDIGKKVSYSQVNLYEDCPKGRKDR